MKVFKILWMEESLHHLGWLKHLMGYTTYQLQQGFATIHRSKQLTSSRAFPGMEINP